MKFEADLSVQSTIDVLAARAITLNHDRFGVGLDWSDGSIAHVETALGEIHKEAKQRELKPEVVYGIAQLYGSYIGEVYRKNHGAEWGLVALGDQNLPGLRSTQGAIVFWPWGKAHERIVNGPEDGITYYYNILLQKTSAG